MARRLPALAERLGLSGGALCAKHGLDEALLEDRNARIPLELVLSGLEALLEQTGHPSLGLELAAAAPPEVYHTPGLVLLASDCLKEGFARAFELQRLWGDGDRFGLCSPEALGRLEPGLVVTFQIPSPRRPAHQLLEVCALAETMMAARMLTGQLEARAMALHLPNSSDDPAALQDFFGVRPELSTPRAALVLDQALVEQRLLHANAMFRQIFEQQGKEELEALPPADDFLELVRAELLRGLARGRAALSDCAAALAQSERTLERRLFERGTSYQALLDEVRKARALQLLSVGLPVEEIAALLGYAERSSFHRACVRWFGKTPAELRKKLSAP